MLFPYANYSGGPIHETAVPTLHTYLEMEKTSSKSFSRMLEARNSGPGMPCGLGLGALHAVDAQDAAPPSSGPRVPEEFLGSHAVFEELYLGSTMIQLVNHQCPHYMMVIFGIEVRHYITISPSYRHCITIFPRHIMS